VSCNLSVIVTNLTGKKVYEKDMGFVNAGTHKIIINATSFKSGMFFYTIKTDENSVTRKMIVE